MAGVRNPVSLIRRAALPALAFLIIANFAGYAVMGPNGVSSWGDYRREKADRSVELARLEAARSRLAHRVRLLDPRDADPDLAEEMIRGNLGYVRPDEVIVPLDGTAAPAAPGRATPAAAGTARR